MEKSIIEKLREKVKASQESQRQLFKNPPNFQYSYKLDESVRKRIESSPYFVYLRRKIRSHSQH